MRSSTKEQVQGKFHEMKGSAKVAVGNALHSPGVAAEGHTEKLAGKAQANLGKAKEKLEKNRKP